MRLNFKFSNLFGTAYKRGGIVFSHNGFGLLCPVGNQITVYDLKRDEALTLELNSFHDVCHIALSPSMALAVAVNEVGESSIISLISGEVVSVHPFRNPVAAVAFSPDGKFIGFAKGHTVMVFYAPTLRRQINHLELYRVFYGFNDEVTTIDWSSDSNVFIAGSLDSTCRIFSVHRIKQLIIYTLSGHKNPIVGCFFFQDSLNSVTISCDGEVCVWESSFNPDELVSASETCEKALFRLSKRFRYISSTDTIIHDLATATAFHKGLRLLATGFDSGLLMLHLLPEFSIIAEVKLFSSPISTLAVNCSGDWIGVGCEAHGQLTVWEWRSQTCYFKAESHAKQMTSLAYSPDGLHLATGGYDSKVKVWRVAGGRAIVTFTDHTAAVTAVAFPSLKAKVVISSSLDGTVRAHDLVRYRNFRTLSVPTRQVQFASLSVDAPGTLVASGSLDTFESFVWSLKTGVLLTTLSGHTAPISGLAFNPDISGFGLELASVSWDNSLRLWDLTGNSTDEDNTAAMGSVKEVVNFSHDILFVAYRGDGKELAMSLLTGNIVFYDPVEGVEKGTISGHYDLGVSQTTEKDLVTPKRAAQAKQFHTLAYSADGEHLLAAGDSKFICLYSVPDRVLLKRFEISCNMSLDGVQEIHDRRHFLANRCTEIDLGTKVQEKSSLPIPANRLGEDHSRRIWRPEIRVSSLQFSPTGDAFAATTTEGVLIYSLSIAGSGFNLAGHFGPAQDSHGGAWMFEAVGLDEHATPQNARLASSAGQHAEALDIAVRLRLHDLVEEVIEAIPDDLIEFLARQLPTHQVTQYMVPFLARQLGGRSKHVGFYVHWADAVLRAHGLILRRGAANCALAQIEPGRDTQPEPQINEPNTQFSQPGFLTERGEWSMCQANLVRLQASLDRVKSVLVQRCEAVDNMWHYLDNLARLKSIQPVTSSLSDVEGTRQSDTLLTVSQHHSLGSNASEDHVEQSKRKKGSKSRVPHHERT